MTAPKPAPDLRSTAESLGHALPALLAQAQQLAASLAFGAHGRRRAGAGDEFWQYRPAQAGDAAQMIDWRRSAKTDAAFVREREWQAQNTLAFWVDGAQSMRYASGQNLPPKGMRAQVLALALAVMLLRGGEKVGLVGGQAPKTGRAHLGDLAAEMLASGDKADYGQAPPDDQGQAGRLIYLSDFLGPLEPLKTAMARAANGGARGALVQILDPAEESFPFQGRMVFLSMGGSARHETHSAADLRARYLDKLAARKADLAALARALGWDYTLHHTDKPALTALVWAHGVVSGRVQ